MNIDYYGLESEEYYDKISNYFLKHDSYQSYLFETLENTHKILSNFIPDKNSRILDLGCGIGTFIKYLNNNGFINTIGVNNSKKIYDISKQRYTDINIIKDDMIQYMTKYKKAFDIIFNIESVGYVDINNYFREAYNCLDDNGLIILKDFTTLDDPGDTGKAWGNYTFYNHEEIINSAIKYNFKIVSVKFINPNTVTNTDFQEAIKDINHEYVTSIKYNKKRNVIRYCIYAFKKYKIDS